MNGRIERPVQPPALTESLFGAVRRFWPFVSGRVLPFVLFLLIYRPAFQEIERLYAEGAPTLTLLNKALTLAFIVLILLLFIVRHDPSGPRSTLFGRFVAVAGTFSVALFALVSPVPPRPLLGGIALGIQLIGVTWSLASLVVLGRCFGIFPDVRGLVRRGPYRLVRHPLYLGELVALFGALLPGISVAGFAVWALAAALQIWRTVWEERALRAAFPQQYPAYATRTRRLIPFLW